VRNCGVFDASIWAGEGGREGGREGERERGVGVGLGLFSSGLKSSNSLKIRSTFSEESLSVGFQLNCHQREIDKIDGEGRGEGGREGGRDGSARDTHPLTV